jgi:hypothetical protein
MEASRKLGMGAQQAMRTAQQLYEGVNLGKGVGTMGLITYMRTDSVHLSEKAMADATATIGKQYGREYVLASARQYKTKSKGAQEAHEAIRPTDVTRTPQVLSSTLAGEQQAPALTRGLSAVVVAASVDADAAAAAGAQHKSMAKQAVCFSPVVSVRVWPSLMPDTTGYCDITLASCSISTGKSSEGNTSPAIRRIFANLVVSRRWSTSLCTQVCSKQLSVFRRVPPQSMKFLATCPTSVM